MPSSVRMSWIQNAMSSVSSTLSPEDGSSSSSSFGLGAERAPHLDDLADAVGQVDDEAVAIRLQVEEVDHLLDRLAVRELQRAHARQEQQLLDEARAPVGVAAEEQVLQHGGVLEQLDVLEGARDAAPGDLVGRHPGDVLVRGRSAGPAVGS